MCFNNLIYFTNVPNCTLERKDTIPLQTSELGECKSDTLSRQEDIPEMPSTINDAKCILLTKLRTATQELESSSSTEYCIQLCNLITAITRALAKINKLKNDLQQT